MVKYVLYIIHYSILYIYMYINFIITLEKFRGKICTKLQICFNYSKHPGKEV